MLVTAISNMADEDGAGDVIEESMDYQTHPVGRFNIDCLTTYLRPFLGVSQVLL
jgi:hypothetical protein